MAGISATKFYALRADCVFYPTAWQGTWNGVPSGNTNTNTMDPVKEDGPSSARTQSKAQVVPWRLGVQRLVSRRLAGQTISGTLDVLLGISESDAAADFVWKVYAYITAGDTDSIRGELLDYEAPGSEWPTTATGIRLPSAQTMTSVDAEEDDRIVIELGIYTTSADGTSRTASIRIGAMVVAQGFTPLSDLTEGSTSVSTLAGYIEFSNAITLKDPPPNDAFGGAIELSGSFVQLVDITTAERDGDENEPPDVGAPTVAVARYNSVWYKWICPVDQSATVTANIFNGVSTFATCLQVLTGSPGSFTVVDSAAANDPSFESINFAATMGTTYYFLVTTLYFGGGALTFTFTPGVEPEAADETAAIVFIDGANLTSHTAMGWIKLLADDLAIRHFYYVGLGVTPFIPGNPYVWLGTQTDGVTLVLNVYDGGSLDEYVGPVLVVGTWYHWVYVKTGDSHSIFLSTESGTPHDVLQVIGPEIKAAGIDTPECAFLYGKLGTMVPKATKLWTEALTVTQIRIERETYAGVFKDGLWTVRQWRTEHVPGSLGHDYSGWLHPIGSALVGGGTSWNLIRGPVLSTLPTCPFADDFEHYTPGYWGSVEYQPDYFPGVVDQARWWGEYVSVPSVNCFISTGAGVGGSQAFESRDQSAQIWFELNGGGSRCGTCSFYSFKRTTAPNESEGTQRGVEFAVASLPAGMGPFVFLNDLFGPDLHLYFFLDASEEIVPNVYVPDIYQLFRVTWRMSTVTEDFSGVNPDGQLQILVDGLSVYDRSDLVLGGDPSEWVSSLNRWNMAAFFWSGYLDGVRIGMGCDTNEQGVIGPLKWIEWYRRVP